MFCVWNISMMLCVPMHRNVQDVCMQCFADKVMRMMWCARSHTFEHRRYQDVRHCMHHVLNEINRRHPWKMQRKKLPTACPATESMRMMWCVGSQSSVSHLTSCFMILSGYKPWSQIGLDHVVPNAGLYNAKQTLLYYPLFFRFVCSIILCVVLKLWSAFCQTMDGYETIIIMFCARHILMMWCDYVPSNVQDVRIQCRADELMCMVWCAMSRTFEHSGY